MLLLSLLACQPTSIKLEDTADSPVDSVPVDSGDDTADSEAVVAPVAVIATPGPATVGEPLTLDGSGSYDPDGEALTGYDWACADGQTGAGPTATFTFAAGVQTCTLVVSDSEGLSGTASVEFSVENDGATHAVWTIMVFMNGDNDLEEWALGDMNELEQVGSTDEVNFIVQIDRSPDYSRADGDWKGTRRYRVEADASTRTISSTVLEDLGATDAGDPGTIIDFATWSVDNYPADHYALVFWDHGWGWTAAPESAAPKKGISWDESTNSDISPAHGELLEIVDAVDEKIGGKLDIVGMDACIMGNWEIAQQMRNSALVYLASQDYEGSDGYDYTGMSDLTADPNMDAATLATSVALHFHEIPDSTMSAIDLTQMDAVTASLTTLSDALLRSEDPAAMMDTMASDAQGFDGSHSTDHDLADMLDKLAAMDPNAEEADPATADIVAAAIAARATLDSAIIVNYNLGGAVKNANGLSLYSPVSGRLDMSWYGGSWAAETTWGDFLTAARTR